MRMIKPGLLAPLIAISIACGPPPTTESPAAPVSESVPERFDCRAWQQVESGTAASFRGLSAVSDDVVWVSGTGGTWGRTTDGGATWTMSTVPGAEELDFRDVDAFDESTAYLMSAGPGEASRIFKTIDGGATWDLQHTNPSPEGFYDGLAFWDSQHGLAYGDPVGDRMVVLATVDGGATWERVEGVPPAYGGEAGFAASGSGLAVAAGGHAWFGTGGPHPRVFHSSDHGQTWRAEETGMRAGESSTGIFSVAFHDEMHGVAVGGKYDEPEAGWENAIRTTDGGETWQLIEDRPPAGYRSAVAYVPGSAGQILVAVGTSGSDLSLDGGESWEPMGSGAYNSVSFGDSPCSGWAAGPDGPAGPPGTQPVTAEELKRLLGLEPMPLEGGFYARTYRSEIALPPATLPERFGGERRASTAIYFLLTPDTFSALHRLAGDEIYHFYLGDPVDMLLLHQDGRSEEIRLGQGIREGMHLQVVAPGGCWQGSSLAPGGEFALLGTTMAPGFDWHDFELGDYQALAAGFPEQRDRIRELVRG